MSDKNENEEEHRDHAVIQNEIGLQLWTVRRSEHVTERSLENFISDGKQGGFVQIGPEIPVRGTGSLGGSLPRMDVRKAKHNTNDLHYGTDDSWGDEQAAVLDEIDFKVSALVSAFANKHVIQNICWLLKFYKNNSTRTLCILQKICEDLELPPMSYIYMYIFCLTKFCSYHSSPYSTISCVSRSHVHGRIMKILFVF